MDAQLLDVTAPAYVDGLSFAVGGEDNEVMKAEKWNSSPTT